MAKEYYISYINYQTDPSKMFTHELVDMLISGNYLNLLRSSDPFIKELRRRKPQETDSLMQLPNITINLLGYVIRKEELEERLWKNGNVVNANPDWKQLEKVIAAKYPQVNAEQVVKRYTLGNGDGGLSQSLFLLPHG